MKLLNIFTVLDSVFIVVFKLDHNIQNMAICTNCT